MDDFYLISSGLVSMETTIGNSNPDLWKHVKPVGQVSEWIRSTVANRLGTSGSSWTGTFGMYNSGTYNNQWMIVDYNLFTPGQPLKDGTFWVSEQIPGMVMSEDKSVHLQNTTYWASYNLPAIPMIYNDSGIPALVEKYGDWFDYDKNPRAQIFKRDHSKVTDLDSMAKLMRYNNYKEDPLSRCNCTPPYSAENAIAARDDLNPANGTYPFGALGHRPHAGIDYKLTSSKLFGYARKRFRAQAGPPHDDLPVFQWSTSSYNATPHFGHPDVFDFPAVEWEWEF